MKDILNIECVQCHATKYILNDYTSCYKYYLIKLKLFELQDILFATKSIKTQTIQFNITNYITTSILLVLDQVCMPANNLFLLIIWITLLNIPIFTDCHLCGMLCLFLIDLNMSFGTLKSKLKRYLWEHFLNHSDDNNNCTLHYLCSCSGCHQSRPSTIDLNHF